MTFGTPGWGSPDDVSESIFNAYVDAGGNFIDTADVYSGGRSEELVGQYIADRSLRNRVVPATKSATILFRAGSERLINIRTDVFRPARSAICVAEPAIRVVQGVGPRPTFVG